MKNPLYGGENRGGPPGALLDYALDILRLRSRGKVLAFVQQGGRAAPCLEKSAIREDTQWSDFTTAALD